MYCQIISISVLIWPIDVLIWPINVLSIDLTAILELIKNSPVAKIEGVYSLKSLDSVYLSRPTTGKIRYYKRNIYALIIRARICSQYFVRNANVSQKFLKSN
jgi:hypothetical protein